MIRLALASLTACFAFGAACEAKLQSERGRANDYFQAISPFIGYGRVDDVQPTAQHPTPTSVHLYTSLACPFCPLVKSRLHALQTQMGFELEIIDVSFRPDVLISKGVMSVPVVEVGQGRLVGNATSQQLAQLIEQNALAHAA